MKKWVAIWTLAFAVVACGDDSDVFYTARYDVAQVVVKVTLPPLEDLQNSEKQDSDISALVSQDVLEKAPVRSGGSYLLEYTRYDGGTLTVRAAADAVPAVGEFDKQPGASALTFRYDGSETEYAIESYTDEDSGNVYVMFTADLTAYYQAIYPDENIVEVKRLELTLTTE